MRGVSGFGRRADLQCRPGKVHDAHLFRPQIVLGHVGKSTERAEPYRIGHLPTRFLHHLAVKGHDRWLSRIDSAPRQLEFRLWIELMRDQKLAIPFKNRVNAAPERIALTVSRNFPVATRHVTPFGSLASTGAWTQRTDTYMMARCQRMANKETS